MKGRLSGPGCVSERKNLIWSSRIIGIANPIRVGDADYVSAYSIRYSPDIYCLTTSE